MLDATTETLPASARHAPGPAAQPSPPTALDRAALADLQVDVGAAYVTDDPAMMISYAWNTGAAGGAPSERISPIRPVAVALPETVGQVQALVRTCLRHGLHFRATSTAQIAFSLVKQSDTIAIDLRRMNRIIEIDGDNQMAIVEPYAVVGDIQYATMKKGLMPHSISAGWTHSPLASATSMMGIGITGNHTSQNSRNLLSYEWVTPKGEIIRGGSAGSGCGWFAGEGPGPGLRGAIRGSTGAMGALGVFTKIGLKLHPWDGPAALEHTGTHPNQGIKLSETLRLYHCVWNDWAPAIEAVYELMTSRAATFVVRMPADHHGWQLARTNREYWDQRRTGTLPELAREENRISWTLMAVSASPAEAAWRDRVIRDILARWSGRVLALAPEHEALMARNFVTQAYIARALRGGVPGSLTSLGVSDSMGLIPRVVARGEAMLKPYKGPGGAFTAGDPEQCWIWPNEGRHAWLENIIAVNSADEKAFGQALGCAVESFALNDREPLGSSGFAVGPLASELFQTGQGSFPAWMRKIKNALDPAWAADGDYIGKQPMKGTKILPFVRHFLFRSKRLLGHLMLTMIKKTG